MSFKFILAKMCLFNEGSFLFKDSAYLYSSSPYIVALPSIPFVPDSDSNSAELSSHILESIIF